MIKIKFSLAEITYIALLLKQKELLGFPNLIEILGEEKTQKQMDAAREILLQRNILTKEKDDTLSVNEDVIKIIMCCCHAPQYLSLMYEKNTELSHEATYYTINQSETLVCRKLFKDIFYEFYALQDKETLKDDIKNNIHDSLHQSSDINYFSVDQQVFQTMLDKNFDIDSLDAGVHDLKKEFISEFIQNRNIYYFTRNSRINDKWRNDRLNLIGVNNKLWLCRRDSKTDKLKIIAVNGELYSKFLNDITE